MTGRIKSRILSINGGSSSIKFAVFECGDQLERLAAGAIDRIGLPDASMSVTGTDPADKFTRLVAAPDFEAAAKTLIGLWNGPSSATPWPR